MVEKKKKLNKRFPACSLVWIPTLKCSLAKKITLFILQKVFPIFFVYVSLSLWNLDILVSSVSFLLSTLYSFSIFFKENDLLRVWYRILFLFINTVIVFCSRLIIAVKKVDLSWSHLYLDARGRVSISYLVLYYPSKLRKPADSYA